jgi:hypothetical protein
VSIGTITVVLLVVVYSGLPEIRCSGLRVGDSWQHWIRNHGNELWQMLPPDRIVEAAAAIAR